MANEVRVSADAARGDGGAHGRLSWWDRTRRGARQWPWLAIATFLAAAVLAGVLIFVGKASSGDLSFELSKAGIQLLAIVIFGGAVAAAFRSLDARREDLRRLDAYRAATVDELLDAYHRIKAVRRALRASGFDQQDSESVSAEQCAAYHGVKAVRRALRACGFDKLDSERVSAEQSADFRARMEALNDAQLALEKLAQIVHDEKRVFGAHHACIARLIRKAEKYVGNVIKDWEEHGRNVQAGADLAEVTRPLTRLKAFLGGAYDDEGIKRDLSEPIYVAASLIQSLRFGRDPVPSQQAGER